MGPEDFGNTELDLQTESIEYNINNWESERPALLEVPYLENSKLEIGEEWKTEDSERQKEELPQLREASGIENSTVDKTLEDTNVSDMEIEENDKKQDVEDKYYSTYEERLKQTPREDSNRGEWSGKRGESEFTPNNENIKEILDQYNKKSIMYENAIPDFSQVAESTVEINDMTENRVDNFRRCDEKCAEQWNKENHDGRINWTGREIKEWRQENGYSWHERNDMKTCDLVSTKINDYFGHLGGVSECKKRDVENEGSDFDE